MLTRHRCKLEALYVKDQGLKYPIVQRPGGGPIPPKKYWPDSIKLEYQKIVKRVQYERAARKMKTIIKPRKNPLRNPGNYVIFLLLNYEIIVNYAIFSFLFYFHYRKHQVF